MPINPATRKEKEMSENENLEVQENAEGQMELKGIDTLLGEAANNYLEAVRAKNTATENLELAKTRVLDEMEDIGKPCFTFEGKKFTRVKGAVKNDSLRVSN